MSWFAKYILLAGLLALSLPLSAATINGNSPEDKTPDSTSIRRNPTVQPKLPTTLTNINASSGQQETINAANFVNLPPCPGDPSRTHAPGSSWPTSPNCPSISGTWNISAGTEIRDPVTHTPITERIANCPATCTSTRVTLPYGDPNPTSVVHSSCPAGYVATASFNMQPEYRTTTENEPGIAAPIFWDDYVRYKAKHYDCQANTPSSQGLRQCLDADDPRYATYKSRVTVGSKGSDDSDSQPTSDVNGYAGIWKPQRTQQTLGNIMSGYCYFDGYNCNTYGDATMVSADNAPHPGQLGCTPEYMYNVLVAYDFYYFSCNIAAGKVIQTSYYTPASVVCSRISTEWRSP